jgi:putative ABC transport system permease protein
VRRLRAFLLRLADVFDKDRREAEMDAELGSHIALDVEDRVRAGVEPAEARRQAVIALGGVEPTREAWRDRRSLPFVETTLQDLRYAARSLRRDPTFLAAAVLTLGVGMGAATTMFAVAQAVLLRPLPYADPGRLAKITETNPLKNWTGVDAAPANFADWRKSSASFSGMAAYIGNDVFLTGEGEPQRLKAMYVTGDLFDVLGVRARLGRTLRDEETYEGKERVVVLSHGLWQSQFAGDPAVVNREIRLGGKAYAVVGVMAPEFFFPTRDVQLWLPMGVKPEMFVEQRRPHYLSVVARRAPGVSMEKTREEMAAIASRLEEAYPDTNVKMGVRLEDYHGSLAEAKRPAVLLLLAAVGVLFLVVCSNVANLQLGRAAARTHEFAVRQALGAGRGRLARQVLTESLVLSALGGALGMALASAAPFLLVRLAPTVLPGFAELRLDTAVTSFAIALTIVAPVLFALGPALGAGHASFLRDRGRTGPAGGRRLRSLLVAAETALSAVLVVGAALLGQSLLRLEAVAPGFTPRGAVAFNVTLPSLRYPKDEDAERAVNALVKRLREEASFEVVGATRKLPLSGYAYTSDATPEGRGPDDYERELRYNAITPDYLRAVGATLLRGRMLDERDGAEGDPVTIVNEALDRAYYHGNALGRRIKFGRPTDKDPWVTIVGVVADLKQDGLGQPVRPEAYFPFAMDPSQSMAYVVRGAGSPEALVATARRVVRAFDADLTLTDVTLLDQLAASSVGDERFRTSLLGAFAAIALGLAAVGIYGVLAYSVAQRTREIGVRAALGAPRGRLFAMIVRDGLRPVLPGLVIGLPAAAAAARLAQSLLFGVTPHDPATYAVTAAALGLVAAVACVVPAARALRVDAVACLREQ